MATTKNDKTNDVPTPEAEGTPPVVGAEGGVVTEGTGDFAPGADKDRSTGDGEKTVTVQDKHGVEVDVPVGADGENPVTVNNPSRAAVVGTDEAVARYGANDTAKGANEGTSGDRVTDASDVEVAENPNVK